MNHGHMGFQMDLLNKKAITYFTLELSRFVTTFVFAVSVDVALVTVHSSAFIKTFVSESFTEETKTLDKGRLVRKNRVSTNYKYLGKANRLTTRV